MSFFSNLKTKSNDRRVALGIMLSFAQGKMSTKDFWEHFKDNETIREILVKDKKRPIYRPEFDPGNFYEKDKLKLRNELDEIYYFAPEKLLERIDINKLRDRDALYWIIRTYFIRRRIDVLEVRNQDAELNRFIHIMQPEWLGIEDEEFLIKMLNMAPKELSNNETEKWYREKLNEFFKYDDKPPKWIQNSEWPIIEGKPLVFLKQVDDPENNSRTLYYFYDSETKTETVVEQFD